MKKVFYLFFLSLSSLLLACGQKGPLYLADDGQKANNETIFDVVTQQAILSAPVLVNLNALRVRGIEAQVSNPLANDWQAVLGSTQSENLRFIIFKTDILNANTQQMVIGEVDQVNGTTDIPAGKYLRFRESEARYVEIPKLMASVRAFFKQNPNYQRAENPVDFIMDEQGFIDIYMQISLPNRKSGTNNQ